jgi:2-oxoacid:acceptor oxidoreductase gamma subunit (pyruvate/2-ketoisovalerate family)
MSKMDSGKDVMKQDITEIRWHGRGGQGAITAAKIVADAAFSTGYAGVVMAPTFGTERRGAPVLTSLKLSKTKIYDISPIETPDMVVVLDHLLVEEEDVTSGMKPGGLIIINTPKSLEDYSFPGIKTAVADVTRLSAEAGLTKGIVNSGIIGAFARATGLIDLDVLLRGIEKEFEDRRPRENAESARLTYDRTMVSE